ncbi:hypothetical protein [Streptomyces sp. NPDC000983]|uniref:hypothetical protein n=1 Tax=Streptomyces sp. NPDC000983 TaxID=3154373 RepID=UPI003321E5F2
MTIIIGLTSIFPMIAVGIITPESGSSILLGIYYATLSALLLYLLWVLTQHPKPSQRPPLLTRDLAMAWSLAIPSLLVSFWPGVVGGPLLTALVGATGAVEKLRNRSATS